MSGGISMGAILSGVAASVAGAVISKVLLKDEKPQAQGTAAAALPTPPPEVEKPAAMPTATDADRKAAARRSLAEQMARRGRASTILTNRENSGAEADTQALGG
jgi:hypothetical protein